MIKEYMLFCPMKFIETCLMTQYSILFLATILCVLEKHISPVEGIGILSTYIRSSL